MGNPNYKPVRVKDEELGEEKEVIITPEPEVKEFIDAKDLVKGKAHFDFKTAIELLLAGERVKLPEWTGQWKAVRFLYNDAVKHVIRVVTAGGATCDTPILEYMLRDDWELVSPDDYIN